MLKWQQLVHLPITVPHWLWPSECLPNSFPPLHSQHWTYFYSPMSGFLYSHPWTHHLLIEILFARRPFKVRAHRTRFSILGFSESETPHFHCILSKEAGLSAQKICFPSPWVFGYPQSHVSLPQTGLLILGFQTKETTFLSETEWHGVAFLCLLIWDEGFPSTQWPDSANVGQLITKDKYLEGMLSQNNLI